MPEKKPKTQIDPELARQIDAGEKNDQPVSGVLVLRPASYAAKAGNVLSKEGHEVEALANDVLERVKKSVGDDSVKVNVLKNLGTVIFKANSKFARELIDQPEVESASANMTSEDIQIRPVEN